VEAWNNIGKTNSLLYICRQEEISVRTVHLSLKLNSFFFCKWFQLNIIMQRLWLFIKTWKQYFGPLISKLKRMLHHHDDKIENDKNIEKLFHLKGKGAFQSKLIPNWTNKYFFWNQSLSEH
jgi:hypothetical protein